MHRVRPCDGSRREMERVTAIRFLRRLAAPGLVIVHVAAVRQDRQCFRVRAVALEDLDMRSTSEAAVSTRRRKSAGRVSHFLKKQYGIGWREISAKLRSRLLEDVETVPCNLCGR